MKASLLSRLRCPTCRNTLSLVSQTGSQGGESAPETLRCEKCAAEYPVERSIPRFVPSKNYSANFGWQWNRFSGTQLDSVSGQQISKERFFSFTGWRPADLAGRTVLDLGCGAGRFSEIALSCGASVIAVDYSSAVDACYANLAGKGDLSVVQADLYELPFEAEAFDFVFCFGVLQHTPDVERAFTSISRHVAPSGRFAMDVYPETIMNRIWPKYWIRPFTRGMPPGRLFRFVEWLVRYLLPISTAVSRFPFVGRKLKYFIPVMNYAGVYPLSSKQHYEWALLDTFDMYSPKFDQPQTAPTIQSWFGKCGFDQVEVFRKGFLVGRGVKSKVPQGERR